MSLPSGIPRSGMPGSPRWLPRGPRTIGLYVKRLDSFLRERPADDALANQVWWLGSGI